MKYIRFIIAIVSMMAELLVYYIIPWPGMSEMMIS